MIFCEFGETKNLRIEILPSDKQCTGNISLKIKILFDSKINIAIHENKLPHVPYLWYIVNSIKTKKSIAT